MISPLKYFHTLVRNMEILGTKLNYSNYNKETNSQTPDFKIVYFHTLVQTLKDSIFVKCDMGSRTAIPLHRQRQAALIDYLDPRENSVNPHKEMATHLLLGSGIRNDTCGHTHRDWFVYDSGELYIQVPAEDYCRKKADGVCGQCDPSDDKPWYPKTPAAGGRMIHIGNEYYNYSSDEQQYLGLRDRVESYFGISPPKEPDPVGGFEMIQANASNGVSHGTLNDWIRDVCTAAQISKQERETRLKKSLEPDKEKTDEGETVIMKTVEQQIADNGTDDQGRAIPDVFAHDLRATYCTQLCRTSNPNYSKIMAKTGHKNEETLYRYVGFANDELDPKKDASLF